MALHNMFDKKKEKPEEEVKKKEGRWFYPASYYEDRLEEERMKKDVDYRHYKL